MDEYSDEMDDDFDEDADIDDVDMTAAGSHGAEIDLKGMPAPESGSEEDGVNMPDQRTGTPQNLRHAAFDSHSGTCEKQIYRAWECTSADYSFEPIPFPRALLIQLISD